MHIESKKCFYILIIALIIIDLVILLNIPFLRQILGFLFLTVLPGLLILQILKLNKLDFLEKFILSWGLSISFLMFFGLLINNLSLSFGYLTPLATISLLISFNLAFIIILAVIGYKIKTGGLHPPTLLNFTPKNCLSTLNLSTSEKAFLIVPVMFPALSIFGMHVMNTKDNNVILMFLLFLIPTYVAFVCFFNRKFSKRLYPVVIFSISISLLLLLSLRSNHIIGADTHTEYYFFQTILSNLHWIILGNSTLDACLSISLLPTIYQSILNVSSEILFKILYSLIYSISPLVIYVLSKKYIRESYAFLASFFFMSQALFMQIASNSRTCIALLFFALAMMTLFNDRIDPLKKRILFIVFMASCLVSHYSTTYIFFFILLGAFVGIEILSKKYTFKKVISLTLVILFFSMLFFWYSQVTEAAFNSGVCFVEETITNLNKFFIEESRGEPTNALLGGGIIQKGIPHKIQFVFTWLMLALIGIGVITLIIRYKKMSFPELGLKKQDFLENKFEVVYFVIALACAGVLVATVLLPFVSTGYSMDRVYGVAITILSVFFVIGGITLSKLFLSKERTCAKKAYGNIFSQGFCEAKKLFGKAFLSKKRFVLKEKQKSSTKSASQVWAYIIILLVLIPNFLCVSGVMYNMFGVPRSILLNSEGEVYDLYYVHDQESYGAKWLGNYADEKAKMYSDYYSTGRLVSQGMICSSTYAELLIEDGKAIEKGYIYLRYTGVVDGKLLGRGRKWHNITEYEGMFGDNCKIYDNGGSEVWK